MVRSSFPFGALSLLTADPEACVAIFAHWRWPRGFTCPHCQSQRATRVCRRPAWRCLNCDRQTRLTAGTALHGSHLPLRHWVYAIFTVAQRKSSISAAQLQRDLVISYSAAWFMLQRIRRFLAERPTLRLHRGVVEVASARLNRIDARPHPHTEDTCPTSDINSVVVGIERIARGGDLPSLRFGRLRALAIPSTMPASTLVDHLVAETATVQHIKKPIARVILKNFADGLRGTFHGVSRKHLPAYLQEHVFRFNRRRRADLLPSFVGRRLALAGPLRRAELRNTPPGVDLPMRTPESIEAQTAQEAGDTQGQTAELTREAKPAQESRETEPPPDAPSAPTPEVNAMPAERELTPEELENARFDRMLSALDVRNRHLDPRAVVRKILDDS